MQNLSWLNDPIYFDTELKSVNEWINANELIETSRKEEIFLNGTTILNLYPILVRQVDFVRVNPFS